MSIQQIIKSIQFMSIRLKNYSARGNTLKIQMIQSKKVVKLTFYDRSTQNNTVVLTGNINFAHSYSFNRFQEYQEQFIKHFQQPRNWQMLFTDKSIRFKVNSTEKISQGQYYVVNRFVLRLEKWNLKRESYFGQQNDVYKNGNLQYDEQASLDYSQPESHILFKTQDNYEENQQQNYPEESKQSLDLNQPMKQQQDMQIQQCYHQMHRQHQFQASYHSLSSCKVSLQQDQQESQYQPLQKNRPTKDQPYLKNKFVNNDPRIDYYSNKRYKNKSFGYYHRIDRNADGTVYDGWFKNGQKQGIGKFYFQDGHTYQGQWKENYFHGKGIQIFNDGSCFQGSWFKGQKNGYGVYHSSNMKRTIQQWLINIDINLKFRLIKEMQLFLRSFKILNINSNLIIYLIFQQLNKPYFSYFKQFSFNSSHDLKTQYLLLYK